MSDFCENYFQPLCALLDLTDVEACHLSPLKYETYAVNTSFKMSLEGFLTVDESQDSLRINILFCLSTGMQMPSG